MFETDLPCLKESHCPTPCAGIAHLVQYAPLLSFCRVGAFCGFRKTARSGSWAALKKGLVLEVARLHKEPKKLMETI